MTLPEKFTKPYSPSDTEGRIYKLWEELGYFNPDNLSETKQGPRKEVWSCVMPPPNANGDLHAGHALDSTLKDILARFHRMQGKKVLMVPGSDHAGFETQGVYEKELQKQGRSRFGMSNEQLYKEIYDFVMSKKTHMESNWKRLGVSCDWSRNLFTLDPSVVGRVSDMFIQMFNEGLIYRGEKIVHWNPKFKTSLSDIETEFIEQKGTFYYFQYGPFVIGTARPETKFADKYVVVHPEDPRYAHYEHMQTMEAEWINGPITITVIKDEASDPELGTGAMTITPWHSQVDFDLAKKYNLPYEQIIDWDGKLLPIAGEFYGMKISEAREKIVDKLSEKGLLVSRDDNYVHNVRICERTGVVIEPQVKPQWFVTMQPFAKMVLETLDSGECKILSESHEKILRHWMNNPVDWNISRQIVWGIQIPAWFKTNPDGTLEYAASKVSPGPQWVQDTDTFDTWFSSGQWPLMTLGYPQSDDMQYYPTSIMETGTDLIFKWIPRMIMFGKYATGKTPFKEVYLHGMVMDKHGKKMSKSKGNVISPTEVADSYGIDALRMALVVGTPLASDTALSLEKINAYKKFANKMWNATRFVLTEVPEEVWNNTVIDLDSDDNQSMQDLYEFIQTITEEIQDYKMHLAAEKIYHYYWHVFADVLIERSKKKIQEGNQKSVLSAQKVLADHSVLLLKVLHPFMPFITEEIWNNIPIHNKTLLLVEEWPHCNMER